MAYEYTCKFIPDMTVEQIEAEIDEMYDEQYKYGRIIDRPRMWDLLYTKDVITGKKGARHGN